MNREDDFSLYFLVFSCYRANMNVTVKLQDNLYKEARHKAVDEGLSLSGWLALLIRREIGAAEFPASENIVDWIGDERLAEHDLNIEPLQGAPSEVDW